MQSLRVSPGKIISRLDFYGYRYHLDGNVLTIHLSMLCFLRVRFEDNRVKMSSHIFRPSFIDRIELVFLIQALFISFFVMLLPRINKTFMIPVGIFIIYLLTCFIKTENMKAIIHSWIEKDNEKPFDV